MAHELTPEAMMILEAERYSYVRTLGFGEYGVVILALKYHSAVAVKITSLFRTYQAEVAILTRLLDHPNIVRYHGSWSKRTVHCIDFDYIPGENMLDVLMVNPFSEAQAHAYFRQLLSGVGHAHEQGIAHRDLKAENVMLSSDGRLYIIDWGMSFFWHPSKSLSETCGSPDYAAPEVYQKTPYIGPELDIWALGVVLYAMVTSSFPFPGNTPLTIAYRVCKGVYTRPPVSDALCDLIAKMLTVSQSRRIKLPAIQQHPWFLGEAGSMPTTSLRPSLSGGSLHKSDFREDVYQPPCSTPAHLVHNDKQFDQKGPSRHRKKRRKHRRDKRSGATPEPEKQAHHEAAASSTSDPIPESSSAVPRKAVALQRSSSFGDFDNAPPNRSMLGWWKSRRNPLSKEDDLGNKPT